VFESVTVVLPGLVRVVVVVAPPDEMVTLAEPCVCVVSVTVTGSDPEGVGGKKSPPPIICGAGGVGGTTRISHWDPVLPGEGITGQPAVR
jgi:hypothetical protein